MADKKLCPMTFSAVISTIRSPKREDFECKEKKCAWWIKTMGGIAIDNCSIKALAVSQLHISGCLKIKK